MIRRALEFYGEGLAVMSEFWGQISHVICIVSALLMTFRMVPRYDFIVWLIIFIMYFINLGINGYRKANSGDYAGKKGTRIVKNAMQAYLVISICLFSAGAVLTNIKEAFVIIGAIFLLTFFFSRASSAVIGDIIRFKGNKSIFEKLRDMNPVIYKNVFFFLLFFVAVYPICSLEIHIVFKVLIVLVYMFILPIIAALADEGIDISSIFD